MCTPRGVIPLRNFEQHLFSLVLYRAACLAAITILRLHQNCSFQKTNTNILFFWEKMIFDWIFKKTGSLIVCLKEQDFWLCVEKQNFWFLHWKIRKYRCESVGNPAREWILSKKSKNIGKYRKKSNKKSFFWKKLTYYF